MYRIFSIKRLATNKRRVDEVELLINTYGVINRQRPFHLMVGSVEFVLTDTNIEIGYNVCHLFIIWFYC